MQDPGHRHPNSSRQPENAMREQARERLRMRQAAEEGSQTGGSHARHGSRASGGTSKAAVESLLTSVPSNGATLARRMPAKAVVAGAAILIAIVALVATVSQCSRANDAEPEPVAVDADPVQDAVQAVSFEPSAEALDAVPAGSGLQTFSLAGTDAPELSEEDASAIQSALDEVLDHGDASIVFYDLETGAGISYEPDTAIYGASSFKAPYALYVCETLVETGELSLDSLCPATSVVDYSSYYNGGSYPLYDLMEAAIVYSDNNAFGSLRDAYDSEGYDAWARSLGATDALYRSDSWFPWYCARTSAKVWTEMYSYLQTGTETAEFLGELVGETETSFLREAIADTGATVQDKAGWCADEDPKWNGINDAGIVTLGDDTYIMSVMTGMADSDNNRLRWENLVEAVFDAREALS